MSEKIPKIGNSPSKNTKTFFNIICYCRPPPKNSLVHCLAPSFFSNSIPHYSLGPCPTFPSLFQYFCFSQSKFGQILLRSRFFIFIGHFYSPISHINFLPFSYQFCYLLLSFASVFWHFSNKNGIFQRQIWRPLLRNTKINKY
jgi:hypothetical protein